MRKHSLFVSFFFFPFGRGDQGKVGGERKGE